MKKIFARISMELIVSDEEAKQILEEAGCYSDCVTGQQCNNEFDISDDFAKRILKEGTYSEGSSYIPEDCITDYEETVCVSLKALWEHLWTDDRDAREHYTYFGLTLRKEDNTVDNDYYYDLYGSNGYGLRLCCDGEQCKVINRTDKYVTLIDVENIDNEDLKGIDTTFTLSIAEFNAAVFS